MILFSNNMTSFNFKFHYLLKEKGYINYIVSILKLSQRAQMSLSMGTYRFKFCCTFLANCKFFNLKKRCFYILGPGRTRVQIKI